MSGQLAFALPAAHAMPGLTLRRVTRAEQLVAAARFVDAHHAYIRWSDRPARKLHWLLYEDGALVGVFSLVSAWAWPRAVRAFMAEHGVAFNELANNAVYCLFGQHDRNAGSRFLAMLRRDARAWWGARYGDSLRALQCFVLPPRTGAVYRADNWRVLGETSGLGTTTRTLYGREAREATGRVRPWNALSGERKAIVREHRAVERKLILGRLL